MSKIFYTWVSTEANNFSLYSYWIDDPEILFMAKPLFVECYSPEIWNIIEKEVSQIKNWLSPKVKRLDQLRITFGTSTIYRELPKQKIKKLERLRVLL